MKSERIQQARPIGRSVRLQLLAAGIIRLELSRSDGTFCDSETFTIVDRPTADPALEWRGDEFGSDGLRMEIDDGAESVTDLLASATLRQGERILWSGQDDRSLARSIPQPDRLPRPGSERDVWVLHDDPRLMPPTWGASAPPPDATDPDSGWRIDREIFDLYFCIYFGDRGLLHRQFLSLTGRIPVPPLWMFGLWHSRYYPYTSDEALGVVDTYRKRGFPIDALVIDTDWRVGASQGYEINETLFPDMKGFLRACRDRGVHTAFNDHPESRGLEPLDPELIAYRERNLTRLLSQGLSTWWFDRNWRDMMAGPADGIDAAVWGQRLYHDIVAKHAPQIRSATLTMLHAHPASHRYPIWWTGDITSHWGTLREAVRDSIEEGIQLRPFTAPDVGGHIGFPSPEQYVRWLQWGSVAPTLRLHSGPRTRYRYPWRFGSHAERIVRAYVRMRYRLLPYIYSLAHEANRSGLPLHLPVPTTKGPPSDSIHTDQFLFGDAFLVAPIMEGEAGDQLCPPPHYFSEGVRRRLWKPDTVRFSAREIPESPPFEEGIDHEIRLGAPTFSEVSDRWGSDFVAIWDGSLEVERDGWYRLRLIGNGRKELVIDDGEWPHTCGGFDIGYQDIHLDLSAGSHGFTLAYRPDPGKVAALSLSFEPVAELHSRTTQTRCVSLPAGSWRSLQDGQVYERGGLETEVTARIHEMPMFVRCGAIVPLTRVCEHTTAARWNPLTLELFPHISDASSEFRLVEDDGSSTAYEDGDLCLTSVRMSRRGQQIELEIESDSDSAPADETSNTVLRLNVPPGERVMSVLVDDTKQEWELAAARAEEQTYAPLQIEDDYATFAESDTIIVRSSSRPRSVVFTLNETTKGED